MSDKAVTEDTFSSQYVPDWLVTQEPIELCDDVDDDLDDDEQLSGAKVMKSGRPRKNK